MAGSAPEVVDDQRLRELIGLNHKPSISQLKNDGLIPKIIKDLVILFKVFVIAIVLLKLFEVFVLGEVTANADDIKLHIGVDIFEKIKDCDQARSRKIGRPVSSVKGVNKIGYCDCLVHNYRFSVLCPALLIECKAS